jgi:hypothetical protein
MPTKKLNGPPVHRYTDLPSLLYMLQRRRLKFLDPQSWDDKNDSYFMSVYKERSKLTCLLALCFSATNETYHHWKVFANGSGGIRVTFDKRRLIELVDEFEGFRWGDVQYRRLKGLSRGAPKRNDLPFLKRDPYRHEEEFRIIFESNKFEQKPIYVDLPLSTVRSITLSPWLNERLVDPVIDTIKNIRGCENFNIHRSTLISNETWKSYADEVLGIQRSPEEIEPPKKKKRH